MGPGWMLLPDSMAKFQPAHSPTVTARPVLHQPQAPQIAGAWHTWDFAISWQQALSTRSTGWDLCPITAHLPLPSPLPAAPALWVTSPWAGLLAQHLLCCLWLPALTAEARRRVHVLHLSWTTSAPSRCPSSSKLATLQLESGPLPKPVLAASNMQLEREQGVPCLGPGSWPWHWGHGEGSCCSLAAAVSAPELAG